MFKTNILNFSKTTEQLVNAKNEFDRNCSEAILILFKNYSVSVPVTLPEKTIQFVRRFCDRVNQLLHNCSGTLLCPGGGSGGVSDVRRWVQGGGKKKWGVCCAEEKMKGKSFEGNIGIANAILEHLSAKLPVSRLQRDLTDSTVLRNVGVPFSHGLIAILSTQKGLDKLLLNNDAMEKDLENNWAVVAEAIQTILRREGVKNPYELLKNLTRKNEKITEKSMKIFIDNLDVSEDLKTELNQITPFNYTGI